MPSAFGDLNGSGNQQIWINVYRVSPDNGSNRWTFFGEVRYYGNGWGTWIEQAQYWSANFGGMRVSGSWSIPYARRNDQYTTLWSGYFTRDGNGEGYFDAFGCDAYIDSNHDSIGDGGVGTVEESAPRIAKRPSRPGNPTFSLATPTQVRVSFAPSADNRGAGIDQYLFRRRNASDGPNGPYQDYPHNGNILDIGGLAPGSTNLWQVFCHNGATWDNNGYSDGSDHVAFTQPSGVYVSDGERWIPTGLNVSDGENWVNQQPQISTGSEWRVPLNV